MKIVTWNQFKEHIESLEGFDGDLPMAHRCDEFDYIFPQKVIDNYPKIQETVLVDPYGFMFGKTSYKTMETHLEDTERYKRYPKHAEPLIKETGKMIIL